MELALCMALGCTRDELLDRISAKELAEWRVFYAHEPFGEHRADLRAAMMTAWLANAICAAFTGRDPKYQAEKLLVDWWKTAKESSPDLFVAKFKLMARKQNAKVAKLEKLLAKSQG